MKKTLIILSVVAGMASLATGTPSFDLSFTVSPQGTFLHQASYDVCSEYNIPGCDMHPTFINLVDLGVQAGDTLTLNPTGDICFYANPGCTLYPPDLAGVFSTSNVLLDPSFENRLPGAIAPGAGATLVGDNHNLYTYGTNQVTTIPDDFYIPTTVVVPAGAMFLLVAVLDSAYADNSPGPGGSSNALSVEMTLTLTSTPEPGTFGLVFGAMSSLWFARRMIRR
jgi:hypothetical protein